MAGHLGIYFSRVYMTVTRGCEEEIKEALGYFGIVIPPTTAVKIDTRLRSRRPGDHWRKWIWKTVWIP